MKKLLLFIALTIFGLGLNAQNVGDRTTIDYDGYSLKFTITSVEPAECEVSDYTGEPVDVTIPSTVTISGTEYFVTSIGDEAFWDCYSLTSIEIPNSVTSIGYYAFRECSSLTGDLFIPNSIVSIGEDAFSGACYQYSNGARSSAPKFTSITFGENSQLTSIGDYAFYNCENLKGNLFIPNSVVSIGEYAFSGDCYSYKFAAPKFTSITFGENSQLTSIGYSAFYNCSSLTGDLIIPNSVTSIGSFAFSGGYYYDGYLVGAPNFTSITFDENSQLTSIGSYAFTGCSSLTGDLFIPNSVVSIGYAAFFGYDDDAFNEVYAPKLTSITFGENSQLTSIEGAAFYNCSSLTGDLVIPNTVTYIGDYAFSGGEDNAPKFTSLSFGDNSQLGNIGEGAFYNCSSLTGDLVIPDSVTYIGKGAFQNCSSLTSVTFGENSQLTSIGGYAFCNCKNLTGDLVIPNTVTYIGEYAFSGGEDNAPKFTSLSFGDNSQLRNIGEGAFYNCSSLTGDLVIPNTVTYIGDYAFYCDEDNAPNFTSLTFGDNSRLGTIGDKAFYNCSSLTGDLFIPNTVTSIGEDAFLRCTGFTSIVVEEGNTVYDSRDNCNALIETATSTLIIGCDKTIIPNSVTSIEDCAFYNCKGLSEAKIPSVIKYIGYSAFEGCTSLKIINMEDCNQLSNIAESAFSGCSSLEMVVLPKYISSISESAFYGCSSLKGINIPEYVTEIGSSAFSGCSNLNSLKCYATSVPTSPEDIFDGVPSNMTIQVPGASMASYLVATPWKNYILTPGFSHQITVVSNNSEFGTVTGSGTYDEGVVVTLTATVNGDYEFDCWTEDGVIVSKEMTYTFNATRDRVIIGNFRTDDTPQNVVAKAIDSQSIELTWNAIATASSYNVYRDGELLKNVNTNSYLDEGLEANTKYCYTITTVRASGEESEKSTEACAKTMKENSEEPEDPEESLEELSSSINIYPNPVENELFLATEVRVEEVSIYDIYGRLCCRDASNASTSNSMDTFNVSVQDLEAGVYFVKVVTSEGEIVKRFVKK